jgi:hypothetical protein
MAEHNTPIVGPEIVTNRPVVNSGNHTIADKRVNVMDALGVETHQHTLRIVNRRIRVAEDEMLDTMEKAAAYDNQSTYRGGPVPFMAEGEDLFDLSNDQIIRIREGLSNDLAIRARQLARVTREDGTTAVKDFVLDALNKMLLARIPRDQIAFKFGVTVHRVAKWEQVLRLKHKQEAQNVDAMGFLGETLDFYRMLRGIGMELYFREAPIRDKVMGLEIARSAHNDMQRFMQMAGFYDTVRFIPKEETQKDKDHAIAESLAQGAKDILAAFDVIDGSYESYEVAAPGSPE